MLLRCMCRGYLHAKALGEGGEFLSFVWMVISLKGAKTLADKLQMSDEPQDDDGPAQHPQEPSSQESRDHLGVEEIISDGDFVRQTTEIHVQP